MYVIQATNVNDAYLQGCDYLNKNGYLDDSRNGKVLKASGPVTTVFQFPQERVLFDPARDANPFFHLFEAIWMLGGRNDVKFPATFAKQIQEYSDDGVVLHGAYGHRWRQHFKADQINLAIYELMRDPRTRRVVISMWDGYIDPPVAQAGGKDVPCNTHIYFNVRPEAGDLSMTVCNRSNDAVWGAYGANAVHMSILHEYVALSVGLPIGDYYQISNDYHTYERHFPLVKAAAERAGKKFEDPYVEVEAELLFDTRRESKEAFDADVEMFLGDPASKRNDYKTRFFSLTVERMYTAWKMHKAGFHASALEVAEQIEATDWRLACKQWLERRPPKVKVIGEA